MDTLTFLQMADFATTNSEPLFSCLPADRKAELRADWLRALERAVEQARRESVQAVLCAGSLWEDGDISRDQAVRAFDLLASLAPLPVFLAPGPRDPISAFGYSSPRFFREQTGRPHPQNVTVFDAPAAWQQRRTDRLPGIEFWGFASPPGAAEPGLKDAAPGPSPDGILRVGITSAPGTAQPWMTYCALAGTCSPADQPEAGDYLQAASAAILQPSPTRFPAFIGTMDRSGLRRNSVRPLLLDPRRILRISVTADSSMATPDSLRRRIAQAASDAQAGADDLLIVTLTGQLSPELLSLGWPPEKALPQDAVFGTVLEIRNLHFPVPSGPSSAAEGVRRVERGFIRRLQQRTAAAAAAEDSVTTQAMGLGLAALRGGEVDFTCGA